MSDAAASHSIGGLSLSCPSLMAYIVMACRVMALVVLMADCLLSCPSRTRSSSIDIRVDGGPNEDGNIVDISCSEPFMAASLSTKG